MDQSLFKGLLPGKKKKKTLEKKLVFGVYKPKTMFMESMLAVFLVQSLMMVIVRSKEDMYR